MGRINIAGWVLFIGAMGQYFMLILAIGNAHFWHFVPLLGPYLLVHVISFCKVAPCGPRRFAQLLIIAMVWYTMDAIMCELIWLFSPANSSRPYSAAISHGLSYGSAISFIVLMRAVRDARKYAADHPESA